MSLKEFFDLDLHDLLRLGERLNIALEDVVDINQARTRLMNDARYRA